MRIRAMLLALVLALTVTAGAPRASHAVTQKLFNCTLPGGQETKCGTVTVTCPLCLVQSGCESGALSG